VGGEKVAILHYEHGLDVYQSALNREPPPPNTFVLAVDSAGFVVSDSRRSIAIEQVGSSEDPSDYFERFMIGKVDFQHLKQGPQGIQTISNDAANFVVAYQSIADWTIVV